LRHLPPTFAHTLDTSRDAGHTSLPSDSEHPSNAAASALRGRSPATTKPSPSGKPSPAAKATAAPSAKPSAAQASAKTAAKTASPRAKPRNAAKLFVLDTNVLMHDPTSLFRFEEHDVYLPMMTLEELDGHKKGMSEVSRNARQASRFLDELIGAAESTISDGVPLGGTGRKDAAGRLFLQTEAIPGELAQQLPRLLPAGKADNQILGVVLHLRGLHGAHAGARAREVVLVSKDINMRIKARALGLAAEDYFNDKVLEDTDILYTGVTALPAGFWESHGKNVESWQEGGASFYRVRGPLCANWVVNEFVYLPKEPKSDHKQEREHEFQAQVKEVNGKTAVLQVLRDYSNAKHSVWGVMARNREQNFALNLLMDPEVDFVTLLGQAGTGKTLLTLAAGLMQTLEDKVFTEIIMTRVTVPVGEDIGFLPGTEEEKMNPWMGALEDNLDVLNQSDDEGGDWGRAATRDLIRSRIKVKSLNFMRGRTFINKFLIIDEAQNLTPKQMKTLITRAGPGTKVVCLGNIAQIDTPYLTEGSSGLTFVVDRFKGWPHGGHVTLQRGERSRLADHAAEAL
jgi:PhoH-like ATPase